MREISLHILDVAENAIEAGARQLDLRLIEDLDADRLVVTVTDDGHGMDRDTLRQIQDPFFTTRTTRHVGLGIPLFAATTERCAGALNIDSTPGKGTRLEATLQHSHIDRPPVGDMPGTLLCILMRDQDLALTYRHTLIAHGTERTFELDTVQIRQALGDVPLSYPDVREWLREFIAEGEEQLKEA